MTIEQQLLEAVEAPESEEKPAVLLGLVAEADRQLDLRMGMASRVAFLRAAMAHPRPVDAVRLHVWCLAHATAVPDIWADNEYFLVGHTDRSLEAMAYEPSIPLARGRELLEFYRGCLESRGESLHSYHLFRYRAAFLTGDFAAAGRSFGLWLATPRDDFADGPLTRCCYRARWYRHLGDHERVIREATPLVDEPATINQPWWLLAEMLPSLVATGRTREAREALDRVRTRKGYAWTEEHIRCLQAYNELGDADEAVEYGRALADRLTHPQVSTRFKMDLMGSLARALMAVDDAEGRDLRDEAYVMAGQFDRRNGNDAMTDEMRERLGPFA